MTNVRINVPPRLIEAARAAQYANRAKISNKERLERIKKGIAVQAAQQQKKNNPLTQKREGGQLEFTRKKSQKIWTRRRNLDRGFVIKAKDYQDTLLPVEVQNIFEGKNYAFSANIDLPIFMSAFFDPAYVFVDQRFNVDKTTGHMRATKTMPVNSSGTRYSSDGIPLGIWNQSGSKNQGEIIFFPLKSGYLTRYELLPVRKAGFFPSDFFTATSYINSNEEKRQYMEETLRPVIALDYEINNFFELEEFISSDLPMTLEAKVQLGQFPSPAYAPAPKYPNDPSGRYNQTYFSITSPLFGFKVEIGIDFENFRTDAWLLRFQRLQYTPNDSYYYFQGSHELHIAYVYYKNRVQIFLDGSLLFDTKPFLGDISQAQVFRLFPIVIQSESYYVDINYDAGDGFPNPYRPSVINRNYTPSPECCAIFKGFRCTMGRALYTDTFTPPESITSLI
jgi:hypothetical protein